MNQTEILVVEDDIDLREALGDTLRLAGYEPVLAQDGRAALDCLERSEPAMVITDIQMPKMDGHTLLKHIKRRWPDLPVMLMTAFGSIQKAVEAMREGAVDYLTKPFEAEVLVNMVGCYARQDNEPGSHDMIMVDPKSKALAEVARRVAASDATVLISGESGCGKEVLARYIHNNSARAEKPFIAINCAAIPDNMLEATLFGYEKGAFTGAYKACPGKFEMADGGTLLLDEISEMDLGLQAKLLRVLQEREVERLGGQQLIQLDVRVLATTNRDMREEIAKGNFREDLFYRLNVFPLHLTPLSERPLDIMAITDRLIAKHARTVRVNQPIPELNDTAINALNEYPWPGNVRELDNVIHRALILCQGNEITAQDLQFEQVHEASVTREAERATQEDDDSSGRLGDAVKNHEHKRILEVPRQELGNRKAVADKLGISERTLRYKIARMRDQGISVPNRYGAMNS